ncbi:Serine/threonine-protein kinase BLUS1 [Forsythia ovata]|uniref:Serine/threonine-protein kinase BLUS1 n=1 Tax=Forsythia ovata TaxID=205694 RepID=A0ABD1PHC9_9LAMI
MAMDVWSVGITALELAYSRPPIFLLSPFLKFLVRSRFSGFDNVNKEFSESFKNFLCICLVDDPLKRPSADKLLNHPFFSHSNTKALDHILQKLPTIEIDTRILTLKCQNMKIVLILVVGSLLKKS